MEDSQKKNFTASTYKNTLGKLGLASVKIWDC